MPNRTGRRKHTDLRKPFAAAAAFYRGFIDTILCLIGRLALDRGHAEKAMIPDPKFGKMGRNRA